MNNEIENFDDVELMTMPSKLFMSIHQKGEIYFKKVMDTLVQLDNEINEFDNVVFVIMDPDPIYYNVELEEGTLKLDDDKERETLIVTKFDEIDVDCFLDNVLVGKEIVKNKDVKRVILHYEFI
jgi:hypothetical protein